MSNEPVQEQPEPTTENVFAFSIVDLVARRSEKGHVQLNPGDVIDPKENDDAAIVVLKGRIEIQRDVWTLDGVRQMSLGHALKGHPIHELALFHPKAPREYEADNRYVVHEPTTVLVLDKEQLKKMRKELGDSRYMELLGTFVAAQAVTKSTLLTRLTETLRENHNLHIQLERRQTPPSQETLSSTGAFFQAAPTLQRSSDALKQIELESELEVLREEKRALLEEVEQKQALIRKLRSSNIAAGNELLTINERFTRQIVEIAKVVREGAAHKGVELTDEDLEQIFKPTKRQVEEMPINDEIVDSMVDSMIRQEGMEPAPHTSRSPERKPVEHESPLERTAPINLAVMAGQANARRTSPPKEQPLVEPPSTVQQGRRGSLSGFAKITAGSPPTKRASSLPPPPPPAARTMVPPVPHSELPPTVEETPKRRVVPPPLPVSATLARPASVPRPDVNRKQTPLGIDHAVIPPKTQRGQGHDASIKMPIEDLPPRTFIGVEPPDPRKRVAPPAEPFQKTSSPLATPVVRPGSYSLLSEDVPMSGKTKSGVGDGGSSETELDEDGIPQRITNLYPELQAEADSQPAPANAFGVPTLAPRTREVTRQYYSPIPKLPNKQ